MELNLNLKERYTLRDIYFRFLPIFTLSHPLTDPPPPPDAPDVYNITPTSAALTWSTPRQDGGSPITGYVIDKKDKYSTRWVKCDEVPAGTTDFTIKGLQEGNDYEFRVSAVNAAGVGKPSAPCERFTAKAQYGMT